MLDRPPIGKPALYAGMDCPRCHAPNETGARFCEDCGERLGLSCASCGAPVSEAKKFCRNCGAAVGDEAEPSTREAGQFSDASPAAYTPRHLAERILTSRSALEGERKQVTVLFADLKGSMELLAGRDPEEARTILDPVLERMMEAVHHYEGTVNQVMGDGIMALFGAPLAHEDHAVRACYAALRMQDAVKRYAAGLLQQGAAPVAIRVGINSGEVVVRAIGSDLHMDYTAVGQTTHLAARMEQLAQPGASLLTPETLRLAEGYIQVKSLGTAPVKGLSGPVEVYELTGAGSARTRIEASAARGLTHFVGRDEEMEVLRRALARAADGHGQIVCVVGEPGVGKSRLYYELTHSHRIQGWLTLEAASVSYGKATSYLPVIDLLRGYFRIAQRDDWREMRDKIIGRVLGLDRALEPLLPPLLALLDLPPEDDTWPKLDPPQRRQRTLEAIKRLLLRESRVQPLLVVFEDLHWIDTETQALLDSLVESLPAARLLLLANYRPEYRHGWSGKSSYSQVRLDALAPESARILLDTLLGADEAMEPLKRMLIQTTEGNPFFLEESVRTMLETQALQGARGSYRVAQPVAASHLPATVQAMLAARIDRLPADNKHLLQLAAVIGKDFPLFLLQAVAERPDGELRAVLGELQAAEYLYETQLFPDLEYTFKHALTHETAYASLLAERRRQTHARILGTMEGLYAGRLGEHVERLAHHAYRGEEWSKAVLYAKQAGLKAFERAAHREAQALFEQALSALEHLPQTVENIRLGIEVRLELRNALTALVDIELLIASLSQASAMAESIGDDALRARAEALLAHSYELSDRLSPALAHSKRAIELARRSGDLQGLVAGNFYAGLILRTVAPLEGIAHLRQNTEILQGDRALERFGLVGLASVFSWVSLAVCLSETGAFDEAGEWFRKAQDLASGSHYAADRSYADWGGRVMLMRGDFGAAIPILARGLAVAEVNELRPLIVVNAVSLALAHCGAGQPQEALEVLAHAAGAAARYGLGGLRFSVAMAHALMHAGRIAEALVRVGRDLAQCRAIGRDVVAADCLTLLGDVYRHADAFDPQASASHYEQAAGLARSLGMRPLLAHSHLGLGRLFRATGRRGEAREQLEMALGLYREMEMLHWPEQAEAELGEL